MIFLHQCRARMREWLPDLESDLLSLSFCEREAPESSVVKLFKQHGGPGTLIAKHLGGLGGTAKEVLDLQIAMASYSPSLAIAAGMHQFSVATLVEMARYSSGLESILLQGIAKNNLLVSSAFSEGNPSKSILSSKITAQVAPKGFTITGVKKPCSLALDMDLISASVIVQGEHQNDYLAVALVTAKCPGVSIKPFWQAPFFAASQTECVEFNQVHVPESMMINIDSGDAFKAQQSGFVWFEFLTSASYLGLVARLVHRVHEMNRFSDADLTNAVIPLESAYLMLKGIAQAMNDGLDETHLADVLTARYQLENILPGVVDAAVHCLGGVAYINEPEFTQLVAASKALGFHPPSKRSMYGSYANWVKGADLDIV